MILNASPENGSSSAGFALYDNFTMIGIVDLSLGECREAKQIIHHRVQQLLYAFVLEGCAA